MYLPITQNVIDASPQRIHLLATLLDVLALAQNQSNSRSTSQSNSQSTAQSNTLSDEWNALSSRQQSEHINDALCVLLHTMLETASPVIISIQNPSQNISVWSDSDWQEYVIQSHREVIIALDAIITHCQSNPQSNSQSNARASQSSCLGFDSRSALASHGARGLFLLAYQGDLPGTVLLYIYPSTHFCYSLFVVHLFSFI